MPRESDSGYDSDESDLETEWLFPPDARSDPSRRAENSPAADTRADAGDRIGAFEKAAFGVDNSPARGTEADDRTLAAPEVGTVPAGAVGEKSPARRSRKRVLAFTTLVVLLVVAAVGAVATIGRNGGAKSSSGTMPTAGRKGSTSTGSRTDVTTTTTPAPASSAPSAAPSAPVSFTVRSSCGGRDCAVAVREQPSKAAKQVGSLRTGQVVQISCSTHGDSVDDHDTGQRSDVWYRFADTGGYSSAIYLQGPAVQDCR
jgi:Bacterial SH3 domain